MHSTKIELIKAEKLKFDAYIKAVMDLFQTKHYQWTYASYRIEDSKEAILKLDHKKTNILKQDEQLGVNGFVLMTVDLLAFDGELVANKYLKAQEKGLSDVAQKKELYLQTQKDETEKQQRLLSEAMALKTMLLAIKKENLLPTPQIDQAKIQEAELKLKIEFPLLHQINQLDVNSKISSNLDQEDFQYQLCDPITLEEFNDEKKQVVPAIKQILTAKNSSQFLNSKGLITGFFGKTYYQDDRIKALTNLVNNPGFAKLDPLQQLNVLRNELTSIENQNDLALQFAHNDGVPFLPAVSNLFTNLATRKNPIVDKLVDAIKKLDVKLLTEINNEQSRIETNSQNIKP